MRVGLDLDGVCLQFVEHWTDRYVHWFDREVGLTAFTEWNGILSGTHFKTEAEFFAWCAKAQVWEDMPWVPGAQHAIDTLLSAGHSVSFLTSRSGDQIPGTDAWWRNCGWFPRVRLEHSLGTNKGRILSGVYVDDSPYVLGALLGQDKNVIVFDRPWNQDVKAPRAADWPTVLEMIQETT